MRDMTINKKLELMSTNWASVRDIGTKWEISAGNVHRYLKKLLQRGLVESRLVPMGKKRMKLEYRKVE